MVSYASGADAFKQELAPFHSDDNVWEAMVHAFDHQLQRALHRGVHRGYRFEEDRLPTIRGRVRFEEQLRTQFRLVPPIHVGFDEFTEDITENRILRAAIERCHQLPLRSSPLRQSLRHLEHQLINVQSLPLDARRLPEVRWTRLNAHLRPAVELASLILQHLSVSLEFGESRSPGFLVDMADVFEDFVVAGLRVALDLDERSFVQGASGRLELAEHISLRPDFSWWEGAECLAVGDVKYKATTAEGVLHPDLYQVFAYSVAAGLPEATLIYAKSKSGQVGDEASRVHDVPLADKRLRVEVLNLDEGPTVAIAELERIGETLKASVGRALVG
jgi:5-methylcytosine-specific restriction enzyme subunit McrC